MPVSQLASLNDLQGQEAAVSLLRRMCAADRLPHALLFAGPAGVGKATCAAALGTWFLCTKPAADKPCGKCASCNAMRGGNHPDYHVIQKEMIRFHDKTRKSKATAVAINVIREELVNHAAHTSVMGHGKFFVVEQAELMTTEAQNALLKTLEEPGGRTAIVLLAESIHSLLPTILSRSQIVQFARLDAGFIARELEQRGTNKEEAREAAELADGSLGGAMRLISEGTLAAARRMCEIVDDLLAGKSVPDFAGWLQKSAAAYSDKQLQRDPLSSKDAAARAGLGMLLQIAAERLRKRLHEAGGDEERERVCGAIDAARQCQMYLDANVTVPVALGDLAGAWGAGS